MTNNEEIPENCILCNPKDEFRIIDKTADHAPLGFMGLGLAATMLGLMGSGFFVDATMVVSMSIFLGGFAQVFAGIEAGRKETFSEQQHSQPLDCSGSLLHSY